MKDFQKIASDAISKLSKGLSNEVDAHLMSDLKRMGENGTLTIHTTQPEFTPYENGKITATQSTRLYFSGEDTIRKQRERIKELEEAANYVVESYNHPDCVGEMWIPDFCDKPIEELKQLLTK